MKESCLYEIGLSYAYSYMALGVALRYILEALKKKATGDEKMYMFGLTALDKFKTRFAVIVYVSVNVTCLYLWHS